jgi:hypothetical protein
MPLYQYKDTKHGGIVELFRTVERRDCVEPHLKRITVPVRVGYVGGLTEPGTAAHDVPKAFRDYELSGADVHKIERESGFKRDKIRSVWGFVIMALAVLTFGAHAADITPGYSFTPNDRVTAAKLNSLVGDADINTTFATDKAAAQPLAADTILFYQSSSGLWRKTTLDTFLLSNTNIITGQGEVDNPTTNDFFLFYDASAGTLAKVPLDGLLTNNFLILNRTTLTNSPVPEQAKLLMYVVDPVQGTGLFSVTWSNFFQYWWRDQRFSTNLGSTIPQTNPFVLSIHTSPTNADAIRIWDAVNQTNKAITLAGLATNLPVVPEGKLTNADSLVIFSRATNAFAGSTGIVAQVSLTNLAHFVAQKYSATGFPIPIAAGPTATGFTNLHGLPGTPQFWKAVIVCTNAELGFMVGDEVDLIEAVGTGSNGQGINSSNYWFSATAASAYAVRRRDSGAGATITKANWNIKVDAIYFP